MKTRIRLRTQVARVASCLALLNFAVPGGAIVSFGVPLEEAVQKGLAARAAAQRDLAARRKRSASRLLTEGEERTMQGRTGENPYLAGGSKWDVSYKGIDLFTGNYSTSTTDLSFDGGYGIPVNITRSYSANQADEGPFGKGWTLSADVRSTAGGIQKSGSAPVRSVPTMLKERSDAEADPNVAVQPAQAVTAVDAGGTEETVQKDVDGVLTTPAWDKNTYDSVYEWQTLNGQSYQVLVSNTVKTPEGTVYAYAKEGSYPGGTYPTGNPGGATQAANVLKVTTATDRQGNVTTYSYSSASVTFQKSNGVTVEHPLMQVSMPGGHVITLAWGTNVNAASYQRVTSVSDGTGGRTVSYTYAGQAGHGLLASATTPGGKTTTYGYGAPYGGGSSDFLTTITDPRGLTETVLYLMGNMPMRPYFNQVSGVIAYGLLHANGTATYAQTRDLYGNYGYSMPQGTPPGHCQQYTPTPMAVYWDVDPSGQYYDSCEVRTWSVRADGTFPVEINDGDLPLQVPGSGLLDGTYNLCHRLEYSTTNQDLIRDTTRSHRWVNDVLGDSRLMPTSSWIGLQVQTTKSYNFMGKPLSATSVETWTGKVPGPNPYASDVVKRTATVGFCYWGADKYYQQKATRDQAGRINVTDYYPASAAAGKRGQTYRIYDPKNGGTGVDTSIQPPNYANSDTAWRYQVVYAPSQYSAQFDYDEKGRPTDVWKLHSTTISPWAYVRSHSVYGSDGSPTWGQATQAVEDFGGINRTTTTNAYTSWGKASDVIDPAGHEFVTDFSLDGQINSITRTDVSPHQTVVSYAYGNSGLTAGQPTFVTDGLSGVTQAISYTPSGGGLGMPASLVETNGNDAYSVAYTYSPVGDRATTTYSTPSGTQRWGYYDYRWVGDPTSQSRAFRTLCRLDSAGQRTSEEMQYEYDSSGRPIDVTFAQSPVFVNGQPYVPATGASYYDASHPASVRARASYDYDASGRLLSVSHFWDVLNANGTAYTPQAILANACDYELSGSNRGLKTASRYYVQDPSSPSNFALQRAESYGYDASLDYLTNANYGDGNPNQSPTWTCDAAGNRGDAVVDSLNRAASLGGAAVTNDILGNRITKGGVTYGWDCLNRLTSLSGATAASYEYRADGMRVAKATGGVTTLYRHDGQMGIEDVETSSAGSAVTRYALGGRGVDMIERTNASGTVTAFPLYDAHGNNVASLTRSGSSYSVGDRRSYDAWGVVRSQQSGGDPKLRYCGSLGHKADDESGLIYMRARYYEPASGRFISEDPSRNGSNFFAYASGNPIGGSDQTGRDTLLEAFLLALAFSFFQEVFTTIGETLGNGQTIVPRRAVLLADAAILFASIADAVMSADNRNLTVDFSKEYLEKLGKKAMGGMIAGCGVAAFAAMALGKEQGAELGEIWYINEGELDT